MKENQAAKSVSRNQDTTSTAEKINSSDLREVLDAEAQLIEDSAVRDALLKKDVSNISIEDYYQDAGTATVDVKIGKD